MSSKKILGWIIANVFTLAGLIAAGAAGVQKIRGDIDSLKGKVDDYGKATALSTSSLDGRIRYLERLRMESISETDEGGTGEPSGDHP